MFFELLRRIWGFQDGKRKMRVKNNSLLGSSIDFSI